MRNCVVTRAERIAPLFYHRWGVPILVEILRRDGERFAPLAYRFGISRETLSQTLRHLVALGLVRRNPGYGHPLRPEYLPTTKAQKLATGLTRLAELVDQLILGEIAYRKWTMPLLVALGEEGGSVRFGELRLAVKGLTPRALSESLKEMQAAGLITREVTDGFPPATRYRLTKVGERLAANANPLVGLSRAVRSRREHEATVVRKSE
jgi:DNA-binding HxlR family transcriptional regulator